MSVRDHQVAASHERTSASRLVWRRVTATAIDCVLGFALAVLFGTTPVGAFFAERALVMFRIDSPESVWKGTLPLVLGMFGEVSYSIPFAILAVAATEAPASRSPGQWMVGLRIAPSDESGRAGIGRRSLRVGVKTVGLWGFVLGLCTGSWLVALGSVVAGAIVASSALLSRPFYDRVSRTRVVLAKTSSRVGLPVRG